MDVDLADDVFALSNDLASSLRLVAPKAEPEDDEIVTEHNSTNEEASNSCSSFEGLTLETPEEENVEPKAILELAWAREGGQPHFLTKLHWRERKANEDTPEQAWMPADAVLSNWPHLVLDYYLSNLVFESSSDPANGDSREEAAELERSYALLRQAHRLRQEGWAPVGVSGIVRFKHDHKVLVLLEYARPVSGGGPGSGGGATTTMSGLVPIENCVREVPMMLLEFLHTTVDASEEEEKGQ